MQQKLSHCLSACQCILIQQHFLSSLLLTVRGFSFTLSRWYHKYVLLQKKLSLCLSAWLSVCLSILIWPHFLSSQLLTAHGFSFTFSRWYCTYVLLGRSFNPLYYLQSVAFPSLSLPLVLYCFLNVFKCFLKFALQFVGKTSGNTTLRTLNFRIPLGLRLNASHL